MKKKKLNKISNESGYILITRGGGDREIRRDDSNSDSNTGLDQQRFEHRLRSTAIRTLASTNSDSKTGYDQQGFEHWLRLTAIRTLASINSDSNNGFDQQRFEHWRRSTVIRTLASTSSDSNTGFEIASELILGFIESSSPLLCAALQHSEGEHL